MPQSSNTLTEKPFLRALFLATAKCGKTTTLASTATKAFGLGYIVNCSSLEHLRGAKNACKTPFEFDTVKSIDAMEGAIKTARTGVKEDKYKWVMIDDFGMFADMCLETMATANNGDGRRYWDQYTRHITNVVCRFLDLKCHVLCNMHYVETSAEMEGQVAKSGPGILPAIQGGKLRQAIPAAFNQVIWMEKVKTGERIFRLSVEGVTGPGCNNLSDEVKNIPADVGVLLDALCGKDVATIGAGVAPKKKV